MVVYWCDSDSGSSGSGSGYGYGYGFGFITFYLEYFLISFQYFSSRE